MAKISISEAARLTGKSRTTLHRFIKTGELSTCSGERNAKMLDTSELLRVFGSFLGTPSEHVVEQVTEQRVTVPQVDTEQVIAPLKQEIEHLKNLVQAQESHIASLKQAMLLIEDHSKRTVQPNSSWWKFWDRK